MRDFVSFDLETTGTLSYADHIVEVAAVRFENGRPKEVFQKLAGIDIPMPEQATAVNGITDEMLAGKPPIKEILPEFAGFCGKSLLVAHNAPFDFQFLLRAIQEFHQPAPQGLVLDTCQLARRAFPGLVNYKLATLCGYLKIASSEFHRAEADAASCGQLFAKILEKTSCAECSPEDIKKLIQISGRPALQFPQIYREGQLSLFDRTPSL